eukprot:TRINITY_DN8733_c0_g1_i6.p1 TRINITY_DN8733_c0_g1~~TRINITY_DN8733_c0_g1_i6.p1  ORF type:complete len:207 (+),score=16.54 TRINITY_DN8733_c0_g1_i6:38-658(+)
MVSTFFPEYRLNQRLENIMESRDVEFKNHRVFTREYMKPEQEGLLKPISQSIISFLNTEGGILLLGVNDSGMVKGMHLTSNQKLHVQMAIFDMINRFSPPVPKDLYDVNFVPVLYEDDTKVPCTDTKLPTREELARPHKLRTCEPCWCEEEAKAAIEFCRIPPLYVIEIRIKASGDHRPKARTEHGDIYYRGQASNTNMSRGLQYL